MRPELLIGLPLLIVALTTGLASGAEPDAAATLKGKGLAKSGSLYVIEPEKVVLAKIKAARPALADLAELADRQMTEEQIATRLTDLEEHRQELQDNLSEMNQRVLEQAASQASSSPRQGPGGMIAGGMNPGGMNAGGANWGASSQGGFNNSPLVAERDRIKATLAEVGQEQRMLKARATTAKDRGALDDEANKKVEAVKKTLTDLRAQVDEVIGKYDGLRADPEVKKALAELSRAAKANIKLGPSDAFLAGVKTLDQAERRLLGKQTTPVARKKKARAKVRK